MPLQSREDLITKLHRKKYREAFIASRLSNTLALQIRAMRQDRGWSQAYLAELLGTSQNAVYRLESPQYGKPSLTTLKRLSSIFDVGLAVWFVPFSKLVDRVMNLSTEDILVPSFNDDPGFQESIAASNLKPVEILKDAGASMTGELTGKRNMHYVPATQLEIDFRMDNMIGQVKVFRDLSLLERGEPIEARGATSSHWRSIATYKIPTLQGEKKAS